MKKGPSKLVRFTVYPLVGVVFVFVATFIVLLAFGYNIGLKEGRLTAERTGIIIVNSKPADVRVYVNDSLYKRGAATLSFFNIKINRLFEGDYDIKVTKEGYVPWEGVVSVKPGFVSWLDYLMLIPQEREATYYDLSGTIERKVVSPDKKIVLASVLEEESGVQTIWEIEIGSESKNKIYEENIEEGGHIEPLSISFSGDRYLYKKTENELVSYKVRELKTDGRFWDVTAQFGLDFSNICFNPHSHDELLILRKSSLYKINFVQKSMSASLAKNVIGLYPSEPEALIIKELDGNHGLWLIDENDELTNVIKALPASQRYRVDFIESRNYYLVYVIDEKDLLLYTNEAKNPTIETIAENSTNFEASPDGKRIVFSTKNSLRVYDIRKEEYYELSKKEDIGDFDWFRDSANLVYSVGEEIRMINYDGYYDNYLFDSTDPSFVLTPPSGDIVFFVSETEINGPGIFSYKF